jgi:hypothetical protein
MNFLGVKKSVDRVPVVHLTKIEEVALGAFPFESQHAETVRAGERYKAALVSGGRWRMRIVALRSRPCLWHGWIAPYLY